MADQGEFYSEDFYRHRPWLLKIPKPTRIAVLLLAAASFAMRWVVGWVAPDAALAVSALLAVAALVVLLVGLAVARRDQPASSPTSQAE